MPDRFAIFFAPAQDSLLWQLGCAWHGRDPATGALHAPLVPPGFTRARREEIVRSACHYGFHATLKAPFSLKAGGDVAALETELRAFTARQRAFVAPALQVSRIGGFLALTMGGPSPQMDRLCADCIERFDQFRASEPPQKVAERRRGLTPRQEVMLARWGYPYVREEFRFHMTLTTRLEEPELGLAERHLQDHFRDALAAPLLIDCIALFEECGGAALRVRSCLPFGARGRA
jgi:hypothetical protein